MWRRPSRPAATSVRMTWQRIAELLAEDAVWQFAGDGTGELWRARRGRAYVLAALQVSQSNWSRLQTKTVNAFADGDY
jgi:ketosteroid isomerase-like protein